MTFNVGGDLGQQTEGTDSERRNSYKMRPAVEAREYRQETSLLFSYTKFFPMFPANS
jgi:hypothetical protein